MKSKPKSKTIPFVDNKGNMMLLKKSTTIEDLVLMGVKISIEPINKPLKDGEWKSVK